MVQFIQRPANHCRVPDATTEICCNNIFADTLRLGDSCQGPEIKMRKIDHRFPLLPYSSLFLFLSSFYFSAILCPLLFVLLGLFL